MIMKYRSKDLSCGVTGFRKPCTTDVPVSKSPILATCSVGVHTNMYRERTHVMLYNSVVHVEHGNTMFAELSDLSILPLLIV